MHAMLTALVLSAAVAPDADKYTLCQGSVQKEMPTLVPVPTITESVEALTDMCDVPLTPDNVDLLKEFFTAQMGTCCLPAAMDDVVVHNTKEVMGCFLASAQTSNCSSFNVLYGTGVSSLPVSQLFSAAEPTPTQRTTLENCAEGVDVGKGLFLAYNLTSPCANRWDPTREIAFETALEALVACDTDPDDDDDDTDALLMLNDFELNRASARQICRQVLTQKATTHETLIVQQDLLRETIQQLVDSELVETMVSAVSDALQWTDRRRRR
jgi:hypothetical protein